MENSPESVPDFSENPFRTPEIRRSSLDMKRKYQMHQSGQALARKQNHAKMSAPPANGSTSAHTKRQKYFVLVIDLADMDGSVGNVPSSYDVVVGADSPEQASHLAVAEKNRENGYRPDDDGGFMAIGAYDREHLRNLLTEMRED